PMISRRAIFSLLATLPLQWKAYAASVAQSSKTLCLVPLGAEGGEAVAYVARYLADTFKIKAQVVAPLALDRRAFNSIRSQYHVDDLGRQMTRDLARFVGQPETILIGITAEDIYIPEFDWRFAFAYRASSRLAVVALARMVLPTAQNPAPTKNTQFARMLKMTLKHVGAMYYGLPLN